MSKLYIIAAFVVLPLLSCNNSQQKQDDIEKSVAYNSYGEEVSSENSLTSSEMGEKYQALNVGDTISVSFRTTVNSVCKNKGCWMTLDLPEENEDVMVTFKDYGFFVPKDIEQKEVIVNGKAYLAEVSVEEQKHYAEDNGKTQTEIDAITMPKRSLSFLADGVLIKE